MKKLALLILVMIAAGSLYAQEKMSKKERRLKQAEKVQKMVELQDYKFVAQRALPMSGRTVHLTSVYDVRVSNDTISAYLPYYGRAYVAPVDPSEGGIKFESKVFDYRIENAKKGGWVAYFTIKDARRRIDMVLKISTSGSAVLSVNDDTRQAISFDGYIEERKKP